MTSASTSTATTTYPTNYGAASYHTGGYYNGPSNASPSGPMPAPAGASTMASGAVNGAARYPGSGPSGRPPPPPPPSSVAQLYALTQIGPPDARVPLKSLLRFADHYREQASKSETLGDVEGAFVAYAIAAQYALERVPAHAAYGDRLSREQREALERNGERILQRISILKDQVLARINDYVRLYGPIPDTAPPTQPQPHYAPPFRPPPAESIPQQPSQSYPQKHEYRDLPVPKQQQQPSAPKYSSASQQAASAAKKDAAMQSARQAAATTVASTSYPPQTAYPAIRLQPIEQQHRDDRRKEAVLDSARAASTSVPKHSSQPRTQKDTILDGVRAVAQSSQPGSAHTVVHHPGPSSEDRRRQQQEEFARREEEIVEKKRKAKGPTVPPIPLSTHGSMPSMSVQEQQQQPPAPPPLTSHATMPSIPTGSLVPNRNPLPEPPTVRLVPPSQSQSHVSIPFQQQSASSSMNQQQPPAQFQAGPSNTFQYASQQQPPQLSTSQRTSYAEPSPVQSQYTGSSSTTSATQYATPYSVQPQFTGSSQYTGTSSTPFTGMSSSSAATSLPSRTPAQIPPQFQLPPMPPPAVYTPLQSRLRAAEVTKDVAQNTRPITDSGTLTPQRQAPRPPSSSAPMSHAAAYSTPTRGGGESRGPGPSSDLSEQFSQMGVSGSQSHSEQSTPQPQLMPLESPTRYGYEGDSTDSEAAPRQMARRDSRREHRRAEGRAEELRYPPPITTTSPPPPDLPVTLMTTHQKAQGYHPSMNSMFSNLNANPFYDGPVHKEPHHGFFHHIQRHRSNSTSQPHHPHHQPQADISRTSSIQWESRAGPQHDERDRAPTRLESGRVLKTVYVPRACLHKFNTIAKANTLVNKETCGLLLGKPNSELPRSRLRGDAYVVTTLLIPKQHATSDTCAMEEEEGVLSFTEERGLITLGWIHTHPTQTCFMSSVDLHTHSGFQCMLPESFAVVCAPRQKPNYGIFRLTDPLGLQTVLSCTAKAAFHPHPDVPIYTDADRGHVVMKDEMSLEIVDLR